MTPNSQWNGRAINAAPSIGTGPARRSPNVSRLRVIAMATLISDRDWASINAKVCLVTEFVPMAKLEGSRVVAVPGLPYASVRLRCEGDPSEITGFITHRTDFLALSAAFGRRERVAGCHLEVGSPSLGPGPLAENEEVWLVWAKDNYKGFYRFVSRVLPALVVYVAAKGSFDIQVSGNYPSGLGEEAKWKLVAPLASWTPNGLL